MNSNHQQIQEFIRKKQYLIVYHAKMRMVTRGITTIEMEKAIEDGEIIEEYLDDEPCPSVLLLGFVKDKPLHLVVGICDDHVRIITVYVPTGEKWIDYRKRRERL